MKRFFFLFIFQICFLSIFAQKTQISGIIRDSESKESLPNATIWFADGIGTVTDIDGNFSIEVNNGTYNVKISFVGYETVMQKVDAAGTPIALNTDLNPSIALEEVRVTADVARARETPVAFTNILPAKIEEQIAGRDLPMVLNTTPGVYATQQGGGDGDARITIRGFTQRNVAVMLDGIPVNDMENGWVYWSNWFGLDAVTRSVQVQRGLGASKLALPSVGGTMNIMSKGIEDKKGITVKQEVGSGGALRTSLGLTSGKLANGWGVTLAFSYKKSDGLVDQTWSEGWFYFVRIDKRIGKHLFTVSALGAPQEHGQRSYKSSIATFDKKYGASIFDGDKKLYELASQYDAVKKYSFDPKNQDKVVKILSDFETAYPQYINSDWKKYTDSAEVLFNPLKKFYDAFPNYVDTNEAKNYGRYYSSEWGYLNGEKKNDKVNFYHKPQFTLRDVWTIHKDLTISSNLYLSIGNGGGTQLTNRPTIIKDGQVLLDFQKVYDNNLIAANRGTGTNSIIRASMNDHFWYGFLSTATLSLNQNFTLSGGIDLRSYEGDHYNKIYDMLGGAYYNDVSSNNVPSNQSSLIFSKTDENRIGRNYLGQVRWGGLFGQIEYKQEKFSAFLNISTAYSAYKRIDYFQKKMIELPDTTLLVGVKWNNSQTAIIPDSVKYQGKAYTIFSPEAKTNTVDWQQFWSYTFKGGMNYNFNEYLNAFFNLGYLTKAPRFNNVIDNTNRLMKDIENEIVKAAEIGATFKISKFVTNVNLYYTIWENKPVESASSIQIGDVRYSFNINGMNALHKGIELDFAFKPIKKVDIEGTVSLGDWRWTSSDTAYFEDDDGNYIIVGGKRQFVAFDANNVHVSDAAQTQFGGSVRYEIIKNLYVKVIGTYFADYYANFDPISLKGADAGRESWKLPAYYVFDLNVGYNFKYKIAKFNLNFNLLNVLDEVYISDANNNSGNISPAPKSFDARSAAVFFGLGRRFMVSLKIGI